MGRKDLSKTQRSQTLLNQVKRLTWTQLRNQFDFYIIHKMMVDKLRRVR